MRTTLKLNGKPIACGSIDPLPGSSQVAVFHSAFVLPEHRNNHYGSIAHGDRVQAAKEALYDYAIVTVDATNAAQIKILEAFGWKLLDSFTSSKTQHNVLLYGRHL